MATFIEIHNQGTRMFVNVSDIQTLIDGREDVARGRCGIKLKEHQPFYIDETYEEIRKRIRSSAILNPHDFLPEGKA